MIKTASFHPAFQVDPPRCKSNSLPVSLAFAFFLFITSLATLTAPKFLSAAEPELNVQNIQIGLDGTFKVGAWTSIEFDLTGPAGTVVTPVIRASDPDGQGTLQPFVETTLKGESPVPVRGLFRSGKLGASLQLQLRNQGKILSTVPVRIGPNGNNQAFRSSTSFWLTIGDQPLITRGLQRWNDFVPESAHQIALKEFGSRIWSEAMLDSVDVIVLNADAVVDDATSEILRRWVADGGRIILTIGNLSSEYASNPISKWIPVKPTGQVDVSKLTGFQELIPRSSTLRTLTPIQSALLDRSQGVVIATGLSGPLALRTAYGTGQISVVAVRLDEAPLSNWEQDSQAQLAAILAPLPLPWNVSQGAITTKRDTNFDPSSVTDLQGQFNQSLDRFTGIRRAAPWTVIGWIALFALVIGPLYYFVVRHWLKRPEWTWGTMLVWTILASALAISRAHALNDHAPVARQMDSFQVDLLSGEVKGESWYHFYSQENQRWKVTASPNPEFLKARPDNLRVSWGNRPGNGFRGMYSLGGVDESRPQYRFFEDLSGIDNLPIRKWSSGSVMCQWKLMNHAAEFVEAELEETGLNRLTGSLQHHLPGELSDWFLAYGNFAYFERPPVGGTAKPLAPGTEWNVGQAGSNLLKGRLITAIQEKISGRQSSVTDDQLQRIAYDRNTTDPAVCEIVSSFYEVLGGESYTGLQNETLRHLDLSEIISLKRAVLFGKLRISPTEFQVDGKQLPIQEQSVMVRLILPVKQATREKDAPPAKDILQAPK